MSFFQSTCFVDRSVIIAGLIGLDAFMNLDIGFPLRTFVAVEISQYAGPCAQHRFINADDLVNGEPIVELGRDDVGLKFVA